MNYLMNLEIEDPWGNNATATITPRAITSGASTHLSAAYEPTPSAIASAHGSRALMSSAMAVDIRLGSVGLREMSFGQQASAVLTSRIPVEVKRGRASPNGYVTSRHPK